jgi:hypothetical protein
MLELMAGLTVDEARRSNHKVNFDDNSDCASDREEYATFTDISGDEDPPYEDKDREWIVDEKSAVEYEKYVWESGPF